MKKDNKVSINPCSQYAILFLKEKKVLKVCHSLSKSPICGFLKILFKPYASVNSTIAYVVFEAGPLQSHCLLTPCCSPLSGCLTWIQLIHNIRWSRNWSSDVLLLLLKGGGSLTETIDTDLPLTFKAKKSWTLIAHWEFLPAPLHLSGRAGEDTLAAADPQIEWGTLFWEKGFPLPTRLF